MKKILSSAAIAALLAPAGIFAHDGTHTGGARVDGHAPIGVMADHTHNKGEWMWGLRAAVMDMTDPVNTMMGPQAMTSQMLMGGLMMAPADWVTLQVGTSFARRSMDSFMMGSLTTMKTSGFGDVKVNALFPVVKTDSDRLVVRVGLSLPTGDHALETAMGMRYNQMMQPSTGGLQTVLTSTYSHYEKNWSYGAQLSATLQLKDNDFGTAPKSSWQATSWASYTLHDQLSASLRVAYESQSPSDSNPAGTRTRTRGFMGLNSIFRRGWLKDQRVAVEWGLPLAEDKAGHALSTGHSFMVGLQKSF